MVLPTGSSLGASILSATVFPMTATVAISVISFSSKKDPFSGNQFLICCISGVVPVTDAVQVLLSNLMVALTDSSGATLSTYGMPAMAAASSLVSVLTLPPAPLTAPRLKSGKTINRFAPMLSIWAVIFAWAPWPTEIMMITAATPITMPNTVSRDRNLFALRPFKAILRFLKSLILPPPPAYFSNPRRPTWAWLFPGHPARGRP